MQNKKQGGSESSQYVKHEIHTKKQVRILSLQVGRRKCKRTHQSNKHNLLIAWHNGYIHPMGCLL